MGNLRFWYGVIREAVADPENWGVGWGGATKVFCPKRGCMVEDPKMTVLKIFNKRNCFSFPLSFVSVIPLDS